MAAHRQRVLAIIPLPNRTVDRLGAIYDLTYRPAGWSSVSDTDRAGTAVVVTNGTSGLSRQQIACLPDLGLISAFGAGYENVDLAAADTRKIDVTHARGANAATVADHALALALALARDIPRRDRAMRSGEWASIRSPRPTLSGSTVGILGLGRIGRQIAQRVEAFGCRVIYHTPARKTDCVWDYADSLLQLANESRFLVVACPGGPATHHLIDARILQALGPNGFLVNIARGDIVHLVDLMEALAARVIAGAALDVYENEPCLPARLLAMDNLVCTPHMAARSPNAEKAQTDLLIGNLRAFFASEPLLTSVH